MNKKTVSFLLFHLALLGVLVSACKRDAPKTIISGRVTEYGSNAPVADAVVSVFCYSGGIFGPNQNGNLYDTLFTDSDGRFYREYLDENLCGAAYLGFYKPGYFFHNNVDVSTGENYFEVALDPEAWLLLETIPDLGMWTELGFGGTFRPHSVHQDNDIEYQLFVGRGGRKIDLHWGPFSNPSISYSDSIYLIPHDTTLYTIHY